MGPVDPFDSALGLRRQLHRQATLRRKRSG